MAAVSWYSADYIYNACSWWMVLIFFVISFGIQIVSHYWIEQRKPAFLDSLYQSIVLAPLFIWMELVTFPLGFYGNVHRNVERKIKAIQKTIN